MAHPRTHTHTSRSLTCSCASLGQAWSLAQHTLAEASSTATAASAPPTTSPCKPSDTRSKTSDTRVKKNNSLSLMVEAKDRHKSTGTTRSILFAPECSGAQNSPTKSERAACLWHGTFCLFFFLCHLSEHNARPRCLAVVALEPSQQPFRAVHGTVQRVEAHGGEAERERGPHGGGPQGAPQYHHLAVTQLGGWGRGEGCASRRITSGRGETGVWLRRRRVALVLSPWNGARPCARTSVNM